MVQLRRNSNNNTGNVFFFNSPPLRYVTIKKVHAKLIKLFCVFFFNLFRKDFYSGIFPLAPFT